MYVIVKNNTTNTTNFTIIKLANYVTTNFVVV